MRRALLLVPCLLACAKSETAQTDSTTMVPAGSAASASPSAAAAPAAPTGVSEATVAGTWRGTTILEGSDSVLARWTHVCGTGQCKSTIDGSPETIPSVYHISGDSAFGTTPIYDDPVLKARVFDSWVLRWKDGKIVRSGVLKLGDKPDSVVLRYRFEGSRAP